MVARAMASAVSAAGLQVAAKMEAEAMAWEWMVEVAMGRGFEVVGKGMEVPLVEVWVVVVETAEGRLAA